METLRETRDFVISLNHVDWVEVPQINYIVPLPDTELYRQAVALGKIENPEEYARDIITDFDRYRQSVNLTAMSDSAFREAVDLCNAEILRDYHRRHPWRHLLSVAGLDHLNWRCLVQRLSVRQAVPILEAVWWAVLGKRISPMLVNWKKRGGG